METSPTHHQDNSRLLPSPTSQSSSSGTSSSSNVTTINHNGQPSQPALSSPRPVATTARSESANPYPTTFVQADTSSFKQVVQMLTGSPKPVSSTTPPAGAAAAAAQQPDSVTRTHHNIPPIKSMPKKTQSSSGFKLYERRNSLKNLKINPLNPIFSQPGSGFSPRKPELLSPSLLDFPSLVLSPVTPLIPDPFDRSASGTHSTSNNSNISCYCPMQKSSGGNSVDADAEEKAIKEKGFYLHPSPASTPRETEPPRLLPLFPVTSPRVSGSAANPPS